MTLIVTMLALAALLGLVSGIQAVLAKFRRPVFTSDFGEAGAPSPGQSGDTSGPSGGDMPAGHSHAHHASPDFGGHHGGDFGGGHGH